MKAERLTDRIAQRIEHMIVDGTLKPDERLPAERLLAERLGVSRPSLREAIQSLASKGLVHTRQGGGTKVAKRLAAGMTDPLLDLLIRQPKARFDALEVWHAIDGQAACCAAVRATDEDRYRVAQAFEETIKLRDMSDDPARQAHADAAFHLSITEASHNVVLLHVARSLFAVLQSSIEQNLAKLYTIPKVLEALATQHETLMRAVLESEPDAARKAAQDHMVFVEQSLRKIEQQQAQHQRMQRRASILADEGA